jgi:hypothetical protein
MVSLFSDGEFGTGTRSASIAVMRPLLVAGPISRARMEPKVKEEN